MFNLPNRQAVYIFYYSFIMLVFFVLVNVFLAIVVDAYVDVKKKAENSDSLPREVLVLARSLLKRAPLIRPRRAEYLSDDDVFQLLGQLQQGQNLETAESKFWTRCAHHRNIRFTLTGKTGVQGQLDVDGFNVSEESLKQSIACQMLELQDMGLDYQRVKSKRLKGMLRSKDGISPEETVWAISAIVAHNIIHRYGDRKLGTSGSNKVLPADLYTVKEESLVDNNIIAKTGNPLSASESQQNESNEVSLDRLDRIIDNLE